jgi:hypothetical protein
MLDDYLDKLNEEYETEMDGGVGGVGITTSAAAGLPGIESFPRSARNKPLRVAYPNEAVDPDTNFKIDDERILMDFDNTIHQYSVGWHDGIIYDKPVPGAKEVIKQFRDDGYHVIIFTCRLSETTHGKIGVAKQRKMIEEWLKKYDIEVDGMTGEKLPAEIYIDDRCYCFDNWTGYKQGWNKETVKKIKAKIKEDLKPY